MESNRPELEQRESNVKPHADRVPPLSDRTVQPADQRSPGLTDHSADYLKRWAVTVERHARAVSLLESHLRESNGSSSRVQEDASGELQDLETIIRREWDALRKFHEEPVQELRKQAATLTEAGVAIARAAEETFNRTEARLTSFEADFHTRMTDLMGQLQSAVADMKALPEQPRRIENAG